MCGIIGYSGPRQAWPILLEGLGRLEYRGYDSAGIAVFEDGGVRIVRSVGKIARLRELVESSPPVGTCGIGHTRWATHGPPAEENAHPHRSGDVVVVHNGILENHAELKRSLLRSGRRFSSQTDTEVFAHLI
ncbi:MAG: glutamine--fructose-6-phosphate aminotransferase, partial [Deltaproteobacteria bacterium]